MQHEKSLQSNDETTHDRPSDSKTRSLSQKSQDNIRQKIEEMRRLKAEKTREKEILERHV